MDEKYDGPPSKLVYDGKIFRIEFYISQLGICPAEVWLESQKESSQHKFAALFVWMGDQGKIMNERKFKHLTGTQQIYEFKVEAARVLSFFVKGRRLILTHGFSKRADKLPPHEIKRAEIIRYDFFNRDTYET